MSELPPESIEQDETQALPKMRVGFVGLAGCPNVGKSTLVNRLIGQKISIVSRRPQTTRERINGIYSDDKTQIVFLDLPGIMTPQDRFNEVLVENAEEGLADCDLILHMCDARRGFSDEELPVIERLRKTNLPVWLIWNKFDRLPSRKLSDRHQPPPGAPEYERTFTISAKHGQQVEGLLESIREVLPEGHPYYDPEMVCDRNLRFLASEMVREKLFRFLGEELPYATATETEEFDEERGGKTYIRVTIYVERESQKPMVIGKNGLMLKKIGEAARKEIEALCDAAVYLELWVKVRPKWRKNEMELLRLGLKNRVSG